MFHHSSLMPCVWLLFRQPDPTRWMDARTDADAASLTSSLSLTSALSASVVLASRLPTTSHVFSLILLSVLLFAGWPQIAKGVRESGKPFSLALTVSVVLLALSFLPLDPAGPMWIFAGVLGLVNGVGPLGLWWAWRWKTHRKGRWDAAQVTVKRRMSVNRR